MGDRYHCKNSGRNVHISREGVSLAGISEAAESLGLRSLTVKVSYHSSTDQPGLTEFPLPCIAHWEQRHFVVVYKINKNYVWIADPAHGKIKLTKEQFKKSWCSDGDQGIVLGLEPSPEFYQSACEQTSTGVWGSLIPYLTPHKRMLVQFMIGIVVGLLLQVMFPFLSQTLIDSGVQNQDLNLVTLILIAQVILYVSQTFVQFLQS